MLFLPEFLIIIILVLHRTVVAISNNNNNKYQFFDRDKDLSHFNNALLELSNTAIIHQKGRQNFYKPLLSSDHYSNLNYHQYNNNNNNNNPYKIYSANKFQQSAFIENTQEPIMDALFSIAQNDDLQCVPKLLCEITSGGLTGRQIDLPINLNVDSLTTLLSGVNSANMSPILHFGKAAFLGFTSKGNSRSCFYAYPKCPSDPNKLLKYLNNHNGGFFRYFQGFSSPPSPDKYNSIIPSGNDDDDDDDIAKTLSAEKRIQNRPYYTDDDNNNNNFHYYKEHRGLNSFFENSNTKVAFPENNEKNNNNNNDEGFLHQLSLKFPTTENDKNVRQSKKLIKFFDDNDDNGEYQKPLPNHIPTRNIFPDRTGTGELKLDFNELEHHYQNSLLTTNNNNNDEYQQLLYDSFPMDKIRKPSISIFPK